MDFSRFFEEKSSWFGVSVGFSDLEELGWSPAGEGSLKA
jgi:hypothetical protein